MATTLENTIYRSLKEVIAKKIPNTFVFTNGNMTGQSYNENAARKSLEDYEEALLQAEEKKEHERKFGRKK